jgi:hypothetical protein
VNQWMKPLNANDRPNLVDMGRHSAGRIVSVDSASPHAVGREVVPGKTAMYLRRSCRGKAGCLLHQVVISERGNQAGSAHPSQEDGHACGPQMESVWGGVSVVVRGRESRPHGEGRQQVRSSTEGGRYAAE